MNFSTFLRGAVLTALAAATLSASTLTEIRFTSNGGSFINDTIFEGGTSPLAFTNTGSTANAFLNNANSTITLNYGSYYAIAFLGFGQHLGLVTKQVSQVPRALGCKA